jgi:hypothetical protein
MQGHRGSAGASERNPFLARPTRAIDVVDHRALDFGETRPGVYCVQLQVRIVTVYFVQSDDN